MALEDDELSAFWRQIFGIRLKLMRLWCGASQKSLAEASGLSESTVRRYESGRTTPVRDRLERLAAALHTTADYLAHGQGVPNAEEFAAMRLYWTLDRMTPSQTAAVVRLIEGMLSQMPPRRAT